MGGCDGGVCGTGRYEGKVLWMASCRYAADVQKEIWLLFHEQTPVLYVGASQRELWGTCLHALAP